MTTRRTFLAGMAIAGLAPAASWASAGSPRFLAAAMRPDGAYRLLGLDEVGETIFDLPLPDRGHAAAAHPRRPEAVAFARRPGTFALVIDCADGKQTARLEAPEGRHFYGHGTFSADGARLYTPENDYDEARGVIGIWDAEAGYARVGEFASAGVGPHDAMLMPDGRSLVVANGGIETHPASGRAKLNLPVMKPNLAYLGLDGEVLEVVELAPELHLNSIRHLALRPDGLVAFAMQWQGDASAAPPLLGLHRRSEAARLLTAPAALQNRLGAYAGSVAFSAEGDEVAITAPRGGRAHVFDPERGDFAYEIAAADICGVCRAETGFFFSSGAGDLILHGSSGERRAHEAGLSFDNHLMPIG